jgi:DNA-binding XRE family transcriptional regulator
MSIWSRFSKVVYYSRKEMGLTQEQAAEGIGISTRWYQDIENGKHTPGSDLTLKIIAFFGIDGKKLRIEEDTFVGVSYR